MDRVIFCPKCGWIGGQHDDPLKNVTHKYIDICPSCNAPNLVETNYPASECDYNVYDEKFWTFRRKLYQEVIEPMGQLDKKNPSYEIWHYNYFRGGDKQHIESHKKAMAEIQNNDFSKYEKNVPKCPTCNSDKITKISTANKVGSVAFLGVFSLGHISKTFKCDHCGYKW